MKTVGAGARAHGTMRSSESRDIARRFGENLRRERLAARLTQEEVAARARLHRTEIGLLERGHRVPRIDTAGKLATVIGVRVEELLVGITWTSEEPFEVTGPRSGGGQ